MLFVDEFCGIYIYIKFGADVTSQYETEYWLELFVKAQILSPEAGRELFNQCGTIRRILIASLNTAKGNGK